MTAELLTFGPVAALAAIMGIAGLVAHWLEHGRRL
jgi:hypothetical protein